MAIVLFFSFLLLGGGGGTLALNKPEILDKNKNVDLNWEGLEFILIRILN